MGTYLATGVVTNIRVLKSERLNLNGLIKALNRKVNLEKFYFTQESDHYSWEIKDIALDDFVPFITEQLKYYDKPEAVAFFDQMKNMLGKDIRDFEVKCRDGDIKNSHCLQLIKDFCDSERDVDPSAFYTKVYYDMLCFFLDGKIIMECYNDIFHYFEQLIRLQKDKYPIVDCVRVMITS